MCVNTNNGLTELIIRDLQLSDSGVYTLSANYDNKGINFTLSVEGNYITKCSVSSKIVRYYLHVSFVYTLKKS